MVAVGILGVIVASERFLFHQAVELVRSGERYILGEAVEVWVVLNVFFIGIPSAMMWDVVRRRD